MVRFMPSRPRKVWWYLFQHFGDQQVSWKLVKSLTQSYDRSITAFDKGRQSFDQ